MAPHKLVHPLPPRLDNSIERKRVRKSKAAGPLSSSFRWKRALNACLCGRNTGNWIKSGANGPPTFRYIERNDIFDKFAYCHAQPTASFLFLLFLPTHRYTSLFPDPFLSPLYTLAPVGRYASYTRIPDTTGNAKLSGVTYVYTCVYITGEIRERRMSVEWRIKRCVIGGVVEQRRPTIRGDASLVPRSVEGWDPTNVFPLKNMSLFGSYYPLELGKKRNSRIELNVFKIGGPFLFLSIS